MQNLNKYKEIFCCQCNKKVNCRLTTGKEIYPHRHDLYDLPFWKCDICKNYTGCHHKTKDRTNPLGIIPSKEIKNARIHLHALIDPLWEKGKFKRKFIYKIISEKFGWTYHTAKIRSLDEARQIYRFVKDYFK